MPGLQSRFLQPSLTAFLSAVAISVNFIGNPALAMEPDWDRYESAYFVAYSNASEKNARELLSDLEGFRAAFVQVGNIVIPVTAPKTRIIIVGSGNFSKYTSSDAVAGYAEHAEDGTILVVSATGYMDWPKATIRHEYAHALLDYKKFEYPWWYEEGFAELVSSLEFTVDGQSFVLGGVIDRARHGTRPDVDWDELVSDDFSRRELTGAEGSSAYLQSWLLVHYTTLGNGLANARKLQGYFDEIGSGGSSPDAFVNAFGASPGELWESELEGYAEHMPAYTVRFRPGAIDVDFRRTSADEAEYRPLVDYLQERAAAYRYRRSPRKPLNHLPGEWSPLSPKSDCADPRRVDVDESGATISIERWIRDADDEWESRTFAYRSGKKKTYMLTAIDDADPEEGTAPWRLELRSKTVLCLSRPELGEPPCFMMLKKCSS